MAPWTYTEATRCIRYELYAEAVRAKYLAIYKQRIGWAGANESSVTATRLVDKGGSHQSVLCRTWKRSRRLVAVSKEDRHSTIYKKKKKKKQKKLET